MAVASESFFASTGAVGLIAALVLLAALVALWAFARRKPATNGSAKAGHAIEVEDEAEDAAGPPKRKALLLYGTQTGTAERFSKILKGELAARYGETTSFEVCARSSQSSLKLAQPA